MSSGYGGERMVINDGKIGELTQKLYDTVSAIQYGETNDTHHWTRLVALERRPRTRVHGLRSNSLLGKHLCSIR